MNFSVVHTALLTNTQGCRYTVHHWDTLRLLRFDEFSKLVGNVGVSYYFFNFSYYKFPLSDCPYFPGPVC